MAKIIEPTKARNELVRSWYTGYAKRNPDQLELDEAEAVPVSYLKELFPEIDKYGPAAVDIIKIGGIFNEAFTNRGSKGKKTQVEVLEVIRSMVDELIDFDEIVDIEDYLQENDPALWNYISPDFIKSEFFSNVIGEMKTVSLFQYFNQIALSIIYAKTIEMEELPATLEATVNRVLKVWEQSEAELQSILSK